ncbi:fungal-specific transcription factor domain-containing protein [Chaetomium strumarium]|uniref:Fungal-specific transcription factor domain-containing protein n=1 Tax=Chaetomium strumarium TaxID=1170767 RepID=A0AAJ0GUT2_9PEZI|nr:fungal-specific transcription factor domain-containing protein [Chaetomium strumarium]
MDMEMAADAAPSAVAAAPAPPTSAGSPGSTKLSEPRRRNRPALSCIQCRTRKIRCDRNEPCASCLKSKIVNCTYEEARRPKPRLWRLSPALAGHPDRSSTAADERSGSSTFAFRDVSMSMQHPRPVSNPSSGAAPSGRTPEPLSAVSPRSLPHAHHADPGLGAAGASAALAERVRQLEQQLADALRRPDYGSPSSRSGHTTLSQDLVGAQYRRLSGVSPLLNGDKLFPLIINTAQRIESDKVHAPDLCFLLQQCRDVAKSIRSARTPTSAPFHLGKAMPPQDTALRLVDAYFRTFESVYRILHRPTFWRGYQKYWENPDYADPAFLVQLQLCMAIGTCFQDDASALRRLAAQWIYEAQVWLVLPHDRSRINFAGLQTMCLLHLARETCGMGGDLAWMGAGYILRTAMYLGLHRDPDNLPDLPVFAGEMRRRLWATVLELTLQSSLDTGAPPLLSLSDFDTRPPSNYDDEQLEENAKLPSIPRPPSCFTQTTVQIALLRSFPVRLAIAQYVNHFASPVSWEETIKWNNELRNAYGALSSIFQPFYDPAGILPKRLSLFQLRLAEHMVHRFFLALNHPWLWAAQNNPTYYFARKVCVEYSLKLYRAIATGSPAGDSGTASEFDDFTRLATCGYGAFRSVPTVAILTICLELLWQVQEDRSFRQSISLDHQPDRTAPGNEMDVNTSVGMGIASGVVPLQELLEAVKYSIGWAERRIRCGGETNVKGYLLFSTLLCQAQALQRGSSDAEVERVVINYMTDELRRCLLLLQDTAGRETSLASPGKATNGGKASLPEFKGRGGSWGSDDAVRSPDGGGSMDYSADPQKVEARGFNSIFNVYDAEFFLGT